MSRRAPLIPRQGRGVIVLAGEDANDCDILASIIRQHHPNLGSAKIVRINDPVRLKKKTGRELATAVGTLVGKAKGKALQQRGPLVGLAVHEDLDGFTDHRYRTVRRTLSEELARQSPCDAALALAAWESEAWLLLFPGAFPHVRPRWKVPAQLRGNDTGMLKDPKETLKSKLGSPTFRESDGALIAKTAYERGLLAKPQGKNRSYDDFVAELTTWG
ncbi:MULTISPECIES: hypothetical protein [unclassified Streptomyces]|uniref:hypothetical protein n=1 Tax=unclassified Streptomyces TaxID=2593676 RepID=UPI0021564F2D|nr:hypothetical protein [Streptomyces sp. SM10]